MIVGQLGLDKFAVEFIAPSLSITLCLSCPEQSECGGGDGGGISECHLRLHHHLLHVPAPHNDQEPRLQVDHRGQHGLLCLLLRWKPLSWMVRHQFISLTVRLNACRSVCLSLIYNLQFKHLADAFNPKRVV